MKLLGTVNLGWRLIGLPVLLLAAQSLILRGEEATASSQRINLLPGESGSDIAGSDSGDAGRAVIVIGAEAVDEKDLAAVRAREAKAEVVAKDVRLQIYLDEKRFGPGFIDGKLGTFTTKAVHSYICEWALYGGFLPQLSQGGPQAC